MTLYKVLNADGCSCNGGELKWSLPTKNDDGSWTPGEWMTEIEGPLVECENGYHLATLEQLPRWLNERIFVAEVDGEIIESSDGEKWIARKVRLVSETNWDERIARLFAADCAEHVLYIYERRYPEDRRSRYAIETARRFANGEATKRELYAARDAAVVAMYAAGDARYAAGDTKYAAGAAMYAAGAAMYAAGAARDAAWNAAWNAARDAAWAAGDAAWYAAGAAMYAARDARDAELKWQAAKLAEYLGVF